MDISWTPLPSPIGSGTILGLANEGGGLTFVDTVQVFDDFPQKQRMGVLRGLAAGLLSGQEEVILLQLQVLWCRNIGRASYARENLWAEK